MPGPEAQITVFEQLLTGRLGVIQVGRVGSGEAAC
jgi:hypothetical protein